jgi:2-phosphoglycerate kinase
MKSLVTGYPGTGKSSVARELQRRGHVSYDTEAMRGYMHAESIQTGAKIPLPQPVPRGWFEVIGGYNWDIPRVTSLLNTHEDVFICALADNQESLYNMFDRIFLLTLNELEMERRLCSRITTDYGKDPGELADILVHHRHFEQSLLNNARAIPVDSAHAIPEVVNEILDHISGGQ